MEGGTETGDLTPRQFGVPPLGFPTTASPDPWVEAMASPAGRSWSRGGTRILLLAVILAVLVAIAEALSAFKVTQVGQSEWGPALPVIAIATGTVFLGAALTPFATRAALTFLVASIVLGAVVGWWSVEYSLADKVAWNHSANEDAESHLVRHTPSNYKCPRVNVGLPLPGKYSRCSFGGVDYRAVMYEALASSGQGVVQLWYEPQVNLPHLSDECVRRLTDGWWAATNTSPDCPSGYNIFIPGP
jgi:hypothetical protein